LAGEPSGATVIMATTPAVVAAAEAIPNGSELEVVPDELSFTVMFVLPGKVISELEIEALTI
jgi:hypothetical protein